MFKMPTPPKQRKIALVGSRSVGARVLPFVLPLRMHVLRDRRLTKLPLLGKSSLTVQFVDGHFVDSYYPTIENTFSKIIKYKNQDYATEIIDTAGQVRKGTTHNADDATPIELSVMFLAGTFDTSFGRLTTFGTRRTSTAY